MRVRLLMLFLGIVLGVAGTILLPRFLGPLLPAGLRSGGESVEGTVVRRQRDEERLLLTINTPQGAALATFTEKVAEIDLLVEEGDAVTLGLGAYEPFIDNPPIRAVRKVDPTGEKAVSGVEDPGEAPHLSPSREAPHLSPPGGTPAAKPGDSGLSPSLNDEPPGDEPADDAPAAEADLEQWPGGG